MNALELQLRAFMDAASNNELAIDKALLEATIDQALEEFRAVLLKQFTRTNEDFRLRASNLGRPLCQLSMEASGARAERNPYSHIMKMLLGDASEVLMLVIARLAGVDVTGGKRIVKRSYGDVVISGENDVEIGGRVYDVKSASPYAYDAKFRHGLGFRDADDFGYYSQLVFYADGGPQTAGGWIAVNKSTGEVSVTEANISQDEYDRYVRDQGAVIAAINSGAVFARCFDDEEEVIRKKPTGQRRLRSPCTFCSYKSTCWPGAEMRAETNSSAVRPRYHWYTTPPADEDKADE